MTTADIFLRDHDVEVVGTRVSLGATADKPTMVFDMTGGDMFLGGNSADAALGLRRADGTTALHMTTHARETAPASARISLDAATGRVAVGGSGAHGVLQVRDNRGNPRIAMGALGSQREEDTTIAMDGLLGAITLGGKAIDGDLYVRNGSEAVTVHISGGADFLTKPRPEATVLVDGHTGTVTCRRVVVSREGVLHDLLAKIEALEAEVAALKRGGR
ncbi:MAG TPA: hypothetical protein VGN96_14735 [Roseococcus sp.]|jgi:hypothetical protein|nr:hypothetical protein [Roseococcus sp.]